MIRLTALLRRNPALRPDEFDVRWAGRHAELMRSPALARHVLRYEQHPRLAAPDRWTGSEGFDGVAVQWFHSLDDFEAMLAEPAYHEVVAPDERELLDLDRSIFLLTDEPRVILDRSASDG